MTDPIELFADAWARARESPTSDPTAVVLATADAAARPSARVVLLKRADRDGFVFFTNYSSRKASELEANPWAAICCYWPWLDQQVRIEGEVERLSEAASDAYFESRARASQIGAWASRQSQPLPHRFTLLRRFVSLSARYAGRKVPRPPFWGGFRLTPRRFEFWVNRAHRLHDRRVFTRDGDRWRMERLFP